MKNRSKLIICGGVAAILTAAAVLLRTVGLFKFYDRDIGYFKSDATVPQLFLWLCILAPVCFIFMGAVAKKVKIQPAFGGAASKTVSAAGAVLLLAHAGYLVSFCLSYVDGSLMIPCLFLLFAVLSAVYFITGCLKDLEKKENRAFFGFCIIVYATAGMARSYFDFKTTMNSPDKLLLQMAYMAIMVYVLFETRYLMGIGRSGRFSVFTFVAFFLCTVSSVPALIAFLTRGFDGFLGAADYAMSQVGVFAMAVYSAGRFIDAVRTAEDYTDEEIAAIKAAAKKENEKK